MHKILKKFSFVVFYCLPLTRCFGLKRYLLKFAGVNVSEGARIVSTVKFMTNGSIFVGRNSWLGHELMLVGGSSPITIGNDVDIGPRVTICSGTHIILSGQTKVAGEGYSEPIVIGDGCWICANATLLNGTIIGDSSIVAAGSVVRGVFPPRSLIAGSPAKVIKSINF